MLVAGSESNQNKLLLAMLTAVSAAVQRPDHCSAGNAFLTIKSFNCHRRSLSPGTRDSWPITAKCENVNSCQHAQGRLSRVPKTLSLLLFLLNRWDYAAQFAMCLVQNTLNYIKAGYTPGKLSPVFICVSSLVSFHVFFLPTFSFTPFYSSLL